MRGGAASTKTTYEVPATASAGDALLLWVYIEALVTFTPPSGWTKVAETQQASEAWTAACFVLPNWNGTTTKHEVTWGGASKFNAGAIEAISGADLKTPVHAQSGAGFKENASSKNGVVGGLTTTVDECLLLSCIFNDNGSTVTPATGWTEDGDTADSPEIAHKTTSVSKGEQASVTHTLGIASISLTLMLAIQPPQASTVEGKAAGTGTGSGTAKGTRERQGKAAGTGTGSGSASGTRTRQGKGAGSGTGSGEAKGTRTRLGKGDGTGTGTGGAAGTRTRSGKGDGAGTGSGVAKGTRTRLGEAAGTGSGSGSAEGTRSRQGKAAGAGTGSGSAKGTVIVPHLTAAELKAAKALDSLVREPPAPLFGEDWHGTFADPGEGTPTGWTHLSGEEFSTARWWRYGFPAPAFLGLTFGESMSEGQELRLVLGDNKLGNAVVLKVFWNNAERYFYALCEEIEGEELEPLLASGFIPRVKGDRFYLSLEEGEDGVRAWRESGGGDPEAFAEATLTRALEEYGATADIYLLHPGTFRGRDFTAVSLNPEPPIARKATPKMRVVLNGGGWGGKEPADIAAAVHMVRFDTELGTTHLGELLGAGLQIHCLFAGPYDEGGVSALAPDEWVANALAFYEANLDPTISPIVEVLNEPHGPWFWGEKANSAANALAYRTLVKKAYEAFQVRYGDEAPKIIASVEPVDSWGDRWWEPAVAAYLDGVVVHPYGGNDPEEKEISAEGRRREVKEARQLTGNSLPVYCSEFGWPTAIGKESTGDSLQWTEAEQAANITSFFNWARATGYVAESVYFCHHDFGVNTLYGVVDIEGNHKLGYAAIQEQTAMRDDKRIRVRELPPMRQYILATTPSGKTHRWGEDEPFADRTIDNLQDSDTVPGGDEELSCSLARKPNVDYGDVKRGTHIELRGAGGYNVWGGRLEVAPRTSGDRLVMEPAAVGHRALLTDDESAQEIFLDGEMAPWGAPSTERLEQLSKAAIDLVAHTSVGLSSLDPEALAAAVINDFTNTERREGRAVAGEADYDSGGVDIGKVLYDYRQLTSFSKDTNWRTDMALGTDQTFSSHILGTDHDRTTALEQAVEAPEPGYRFARLRDLRENAGEAGPLFDITAWQRLKVLGRHSLPLYGTWPLIGLLASDVIAYILERWVSGLYFTAGRNGSIRPSNFPIPHLTFKEQTTPGAMVEQSLKYELLEWAVRLNQFGPTFYLNARGEREGRKRWRTRIGPSQLEETGQQMNRTWNRVVILFTGEDGVVRSVGPPGSGCTFTDERLIDSDPLNPANEAGIPRTKKLQMRRVSTPEGCGEAGQRFLEQTKLLDGSGSATLTGYVEDEHCALWPYDRVHSGDLLEVLDSSIPGYRYIVKASRSRQGRSVKVDLDAPPDDYEAMLERLDLEETIAGIGG